MDLDDSDILKSSREIINDRNIVDGYKCIKSNQNDVYEYNAEKKRFLIVQIFQEINIRTYY
ncbi:MAG: hypothetical protein BAJALOKI3v1_200050 [Promethearchaeota archaeon]|nr:MAG: hypothetical protein BAJALOKI3v1_200050 [Candidatus Lokiarchaeota archaeon]